jgi:hypothetical protein
MEGKADDKTQRTGSRDFVLLASGIVHGSVGITGHAMQSMAIRAVLPRAQRVRYP